MTVKELKTALEQFPDDMHVFLTQTDADHQFGLANSVREKEITFEPNNDWENGEELATEKVVVIDIE